MFPAASRAVAVKVYEPAARDEASQVAEYGEATSSVPRLAPFTLNWTPATPILSEAEAVIWMLEGARVTPLIGEVMETVGAVVSEVVVTNVAVTAMFPVIVRVQEPVPVHPPPLQPEKVDPVWGVAVRVREVPDVILD